MIKVLDYFLSFFDFIFEIIYTNWKIEYNPYKHNDFDYIIQITYGSWEHGLTTMSRLTHMRFNHQMNVHPNAQGIVSLFRSKRTAVQDEKLIRMDLMRPYLERVTFLEKGATSTTDECTIALEIIPKGSKVLVVAEGSHSRRAYVVWEELSRDENIELHFKSTESPFHIKQDGLLFDKRNPMILQRSMRIWLLVNIILYPLYRFFPGVRFFAKLNFHQPV